jgi:hypothetical protein
MGIQYPVRIDIIHSLGELQCHDAVPNLLRLLDERQSSPKGGLHLPAMDALSKILQNNSKSAEINKSLGLVDSVARSEDAAASMNAVGVLYSANHRRAMTDIAALDSSGGRLAKKLLETP